MTTEIDQRCLCGIARGGVAGAHPFCPVHRTDHVTPAVYYELPPPQQSTLDVAQEVILERRRQDAKWGPEQNNRWNTGTVKPFGYLLGRPWSSSQEIKDMVDWLADRNDLGMCEILLEEIAEAFDETDLQRVREELIQVAAVAIKAVESIDRNGR